jgi:hypothetical protein
MMNGFQTPITADSPVGNKSPNGWVVQKFGGTSVGKFPDKVGVMFSGLAYFGVWWVAEMDEMPLNHDKIELGG